MKITSQNQCSTSNFKQGFASILTVLSVGIALLIVLLMAYKDTVESQKAQTNNLLRNDYIQREDAFLRSLTNIIPNTAMRSMMDESKDDEPDLGWKKIIETALLQSNTQKTLSYDTLTALGIDPSDSRNANTADTEQKTDKILTNVFGMIAGEISLKDASGTSVVSPVLSTSDFGIIDAPDISFKYQQNDKFIARQNSWTLELSLAEQEKNVTGSSASKLARNKKRYLISLYEIPAQLAINSASFTNFGQHGGGDTASGWTNITTTGGVFAGGVTATKAFKNKNGIASRKGVELKDNLNNDNEKGDNTLASDNKIRNQELYGATAAPTPTSSSDGGHVAFVPILPVLSENSTSTEDKTIYDAYLNKMKIWADNNSIPGDRPVNKLFYTRTLHGNQVEYEAEGNRAVTGTAWKYYSRGANQCKLIYIVNGNTKKFHYIDSDGGLHDLEDFSSVFESDILANSGSYLNVNLKELIAYLKLKTIDINGDDPINSLCVNIIDDTDAEYLVFLKNAKDLSPDGGGFEKGFSIVSNHTLVLNDDINIAFNGKFGENVETPPLSMYAPKVRYGKLLTDLDTDERFKISVEGNLGSLAERNKDDAVNIADLKKRDGTNYSSKTISADLKAIENFSDLPPINMMNWMVVIQEIHE